MGNPTVKEIVYVEPQPNWRFPLHSHESSAELSLILRGRGTFYAANKEHLLEKGMLVVKNPGLSHSEKSDPDDPLEQICIEITDVHIDGMRENQILPEHMDPPLTLGRDYDLTEAVFRYVLYNSADPSARAICGKLLDAVLDMIRKKVADYVPPRDKRPRNKKELVSEVLRYLDGNYREKIRIRDLAGRFYVSEGNLSRQFKAVTGYTVNEYVISKRMGEAQLKLMYSDEDIKRVAAGCGYDDLQYFYHVFKSFAHCTPAEFRDKYRGTETHGRAEH